MTHSDCYLKGHTPIPEQENRCMKCGEWLLYVVVLGRKVPHTKAEVDRLWKGVDREAAKANPIGGTLWHTRVKNWNRSSPFTGAEVCRGSSGCETQGG